jgi:hypothetical protein
MVCERLSRSASEWGRGKLGFTVGSGYMISKAIEAGFVPTQRGDGEANFSCLWSDENVGKLTKLLRLRIRRPASLPSNPFRARSPQRFPGENSADSGGDRSMEGSGPWKATSGEEAAV